ncbi:hypothetical protein BC832DRAFT_234279 [Gaertneriomyces semiglobifer]|nr:hypothetical protein BC832DRAFT_234279 [Gaertneriomyces semiglobifer]
MISEARIAEQLRKEQEARAQQQREALEALFAQEEQRLGEQPEAVARLLEEHAGKLRVIREAKEKEEQWNRFLQCQELPDPRSEREVNAFLDTWNADTAVAEQGVNLESLYKELHLAEMLCDELEHHFSVATGADDATVTKHRVADHLLRVRAVINAKWDLATVQILQNIDYATRESNENFQFTSVTNRYAAGVWGNLTKNPRHKTIDFGERSMTSSLPKPLVLSNVSIRMLLQSGLSAAAPFEVGARAANLSIIGPILYFDLVEMPDPPKVCDNWTIRPTSIFSRDGKLKRLQYPFKKPVTEEEEEPANEEETETADVTSIWPMSVTYELDSGCVLQQDTVSVRWWNEEQTTWDDDGISDVEVDLASGLVKFKTIHFSPTAVIQNAYAELPYIDWDIRPSGTNRAIARIRGLFNDIQVEVGEEGCRLLHPSNKYTQTYLQDKWHPTALLFKHLSRIGLGFIGPTSMKGLEMENVILKNPLVEEACINGISLCASRFAFRRSTGNRPASSSKCMFQFRPLSIGEETPALDDESWRTLVFDVNWKVGEKAYQAGYVLARPETSEFELKSARGIVGSDGDVMDGTVHASPYHLLMATLDSDMPVASSSEQSALFTRKLSEVLLLIRPLCFS